MSKVSLLTLLVALAISSIMITCNMPLGKGQTINEVNGIISSNITLTKADGPYRFEEVVVNAGATLTIEAGSSVYISGNLQVNGTLIAKGTPTQQIYFTNDGGGSKVIRFWSTSTDSIIDNAIISGIPIQISCSVNIRASYLKGVQAQSSLFIDSGSPIIINNTIKGSLDGYAVVRVWGGSPTISNNNLLGFGDMPLKSDSTPSIPFNHYSSQEPMYGVYVTNAIGGQITNNRCYGSTDGIKVESGTITVNGNTMHTNEYIAFPSGQPPLPTPTSTLPTLPPYPLPSQSGTPNPTTTIPTATSTVNTQSTETGALNLLMIAIDVIIAAVVIIASLVAYLVVLLRKNRKK